MKLDPRELALMKSLGPLSVAGYLRVHGWNEEAIRSEAERSWITRDSDGSEFQLTLPMRADLRDFVPRMVDLVETLSVFEQRPFGQVIEDMTLADADIVRFFIDDAVAQDATLALDDGALVLGSVRETVAAAASASISPKPVFNSRKADRVVEYMSGLRLGQSEKGSYVLKVVSKVPPELRVPGQQQLPITGGVEEPFQRQVTLTLSKAIAAIKAAVETAASTGQVNAFEAAVQNGVSANLCEAIVKLGGEGRSRRSVGFGFSWSKNRPVKGEPVRKIVLAQESFPFIAEAARLFRAREPIDDFELRGPVVKLERAEGEQRGSVTVVGLVDGSARKVAVQLSGSAYSSAVRAHDADDYLSVFGELEKVGRGYVLLNPRALTIVQPQ